MVGIEKATLRGSVHHFPLVVPEGVLHEALESLPFEFGQFIVQIFAGGFGEGGFFGRGFFRLLRRLFHGETLYVWRTFYWYARLSGNEPPSPNHGRAVFISNQPVRSAVRTSISG
jgi:hypothetical protein